jgi:hypothetical protein
MRKTVHEPQETVPPPPPAFIGHNIRSRLSITEGEQCIVVREGVGAQLQLCVLPLLAGLGGVFLLVLGSSDNIGLFSPIVMLVSGWGWWFGIRNLARFLGGRRIEIRKADKSIRLYSLQLLASVSFTREIRRSEIKAVRITPMRSHNVRRRSKQISTVDTYSLEVETGVDQWLNLCAADNKSQLETLIRHMGAESIAQEAPRLHYLFPGVPAPPGEKVIQMPKLGRKGCFSCLVFLLLYPLLMGLYLFLHQGCKQQQPTSPAQIETSRFQFANHR